MTRERGLDETCGLEVSDHRSPVTDHDLFEMSASLRIENVQAGYGAVQVLDRISLTVNDGETVALLGTNGNGKSTLMKCIMGIVQPGAGRILATIDGVEHDLAGKTPESIVDLGIALVPEGRRLFPRLTVEENLLLGAYRSAARARIAENMAFCFEAFPRLAERRSQLAGSMSGGEQQMLALARALMTAPRILLIDEPSVGLAPILVTTTIDKINQLKARYRLTVGRRQSRSCTPSRCPSTGRIEWGVTALCMRSRSGTRGWPFTTTFGAGTRTPTSVRVSSISNTVTSIIRLPRRPAMSSRAVESCRTPTKC